MASRADTFNRANGSLGTPSDAGSAWVDAGGTGSVSSNQFVGVNLFAWTPAYLEASTAVASVAVTAKTFGNSGLIGRYVDANNFWLLQVQSGSLGLYKRVSGTFTQVGSTYTGTISANDVLLLDVTSGNAWTAKQNGTTRIGPTSADSTHSTATKWGLSNFSGAATYDDLSITDNAGGGGASADLAATGTSGTLAASAWPQVSVALAATGQSGALSATASTQAVATLEATGGTGVLALSASSQTTVSLAATGGTATISASASSGAAVSLAADGGSGALAASASVPAFVSLASTGESGALDAVASVAGTTTGGGYSDDRARAAAKRKKQTIVTKDDAEERQAEFDELLARVKGQAADKAKEAAEEAPAGQTQAPKPPRMPDVRGVESSVLRVWMPDLIAAYRQEFQDAYAQQAAAQQATRAEAARRQALDDEEAVILAALL